MTETTIDRSPDVRVTLATFDDTYGRPPYRAIRTAVRLEDFRPVDQEEYQPNGCTPLLDATVEFIEHLRSIRRDDEVQVGLLLDESGSMTGNRYAVIESVNKFVDGLRTVKRVDPEVAGRGFLVIATDGQENASRRQGYEGVKRSVKSCEDAGWITVFIGASIDGWGTGTSLGFSGGVGTQTVSTVNTVQGTKSAMASVGNDASLYLACASDYKASRADSSMRSVTEDGSELLSNIGDNTTNYTAGQGGPVPQAGRTLGINPFDAADALSAAQSALGGE